MNLPDRTDEPSLPTDDPSTPQPLKISQQDLSADLEYISERGKEFSSAISSQAVSEGDDSDDLQERSDGPPAYRWLSSLSNRPGPGLLESLIWMGAFFILQILFSLPIFIFLLASSGEMGGGPQKMEQTLQQIMKDHTAIIVGVPLGLTWLCLIPAGWYRLGPRTDLKLNFATPGLAHLLLSLSMVMPLGFVADALFSHSEPIFEKVIPEGLQQGTDVRGPLEDLKEYPLALILLLVAVFPAIGEEFLFRGLIGRGLINRYGVVFGVLVTSFFFACVHLYPPHVLAILPVGFVIHMVYLNSRSYWLPMLFHFANNTLAVLALKYGPDGDTVQSNPLWVGVLGGVYVALALIAMHRIRVHYVEHDPEDADPVPDLSVYFVPVMGAEAPPPALPIRRYVPNNGFTRLVTAAASVAILGEFFLLLS